MSASVRPITPFVDRSSHPGGFGPPDGTRPSDALRPVSPHTDDGMRIEPPPSEPVARGTMPAATAAALPPDEPPGVRSRFQGLRDGGNRPLSVTGLLPNSGVFVLPSTTQPAAR